MIGGNMNNLDIARAGYSPSAKEVVSQAVASWKLVCELPQAVRLRFPYSADQRNSGVGYELKLIPGTTLDLKEDMHINREWGDRLLACADAVGDGGVFRKFIEDALKIPDAILPLVREYSQQVEDEYQLAGFTQDVEDAIPTWMVRFLHYFGDRNAGKEMAVPHADKGGFTPHLYESHPGLQYLDQRRTWQDVSIGGNETVVLPGLALQHRTRGGKIAVYHRVVATEQTAQSGRFSAVCFIDMKHSRYFDKKRVGRVQDLPVAFNYDISFENLDTYFAS